MFLLTYYVTNPLELLYTTAGLLHLKESTNRVFKLFSSPGLEIEQPKYSTVSPPGLYCPIQKNVRSSKTSHTSCTQTFPTCLIFCPIPKIIKNYLERMKIEQFSLFFPGSCWKHRQLGLPSLPRLHQTKPQAKPVKMGSIDECWKFWDNLAIDIVEFYVSSWFCMNFEFPSLEIEDD